MSLSYPQIDTLAEMLTQQSPATVAETCSVVRDWLAVRGAIAFEVGSTDVSAALDKAAVAAMR